MDSQSAFRSPHQSTPQRLPEWSQQSKLHSLSNYAKTALLLAGLTALVLFLGQKFGGPGGLVVAGGFVLIMNFASYWFSDKIALAMHGAQPVDRAQAPELYEIVEGLTRRAQLPMPRIYLLPTHTPNAFATGRNPQNAAIAVTYGLMQMLDRRELTGVIAHELAHVSNRDTLISTITATLAGVISFVAQTAFMWGGSLLRHSSDDDEGGAGDAFASLGLLIVAPIAATLLQLAISRTREYEADATGARMAGDPEALARALEKIHQGVERMPYDRAPATSHMFIVSPLSGGGVMALFSTHPPMEERVRRLRSLRA